MEVKSACVGFSERPFAASRFLRAIITLSLICCCAAATSCAESSGSKDGADGLLDPAASGAGGAGTRGRTGCLEMLSGDGSGGNCRVRLRSFNFSQVGWRGRQRSDKMSAAPRWPSPRAARAPAFPRNPESNRTDTNGKTQEARRRWPRESRSCKYSWGLMLRVATRYGTLCRARLPNVKSIEPL